MSIIGSFVNNCDRPLTQLRHSFGTLHATVAAPHRTPAHLTGAGFRAPIVRIRFRWPGPD